MRLVCPNCGAQYEVDDRVVPDAGRDVQCSACGHAWYQQASAEAMHAPREDETPDVDEQLGPDDEDDDDGDGGDDARFEAGDAGGEDAHDHQDGGHDGDEDGRTDDSDNGGDSGGDRGGDKGGEAPQPLRREMDESVRDILQEEAQRELSARAQDGGYAGGVETQPDLGLDEVSAEEERRRIARERMARMRGIDDDEDIDAGFGGAAPEAVSPAPDVAPAPSASAPFEPGGPAGAAPISGAIPGSIPGSIPGATPGPANRRDLFPDIEEINSTLDGRETSSSAEASGSGAERSGGFAKGFFAVLLIAVVGLVLYILAPTLAAKVPALEPILSRYVAIIDGLRGGLDTTIQGFIATLEEKARGGN